MICIYVLFCRIIIKLKNMTHKSLKQRLLRARYELTATLQQILNINRKRKKLSEYKDLQEENAKLEDELKVLNGLADTQVKVIQKYEQGMVSSES